MPNYRRAKLYYIRSHLRPDLIYIGATCCELSVRFGQHKSTRNNTRSKQIIELGDAYIELIELYPCDSKEELSRREGELIRSMDCVNKFVPGRTKAEYREDNPRYHENNKEQIKKKQNDYSERMKQHRESAKNMYMCICGDRFNSGIKSKRNQHLRSNRHTEFVNCFPFN